jgi:hypothetical protein
MLNACSAGISWKVVHTYFLNAVSVIESGNSVWQDVMWPILLLYGRIYFNWGSKSLKAILCRLVLGSAVYNIWITQNELKHAGHPITEEQILKKIMWEVRTRVVGKGIFSRTRENLMFCSLWNLPTDLLVA